MPCANNNCGHRTWCQVKATEAIDPATCDEARVIAQWWNDKISGKRDPYPDDDEEIPFADEDFVPEDFEDG